MSDLVPLDSYLSTNKQFLKVSIISMHLAYIAILTNELI